MIDGNEADYKESIKIEILKPEEDIDDSDKNTKWFENYENVLQGIENALNNKLWHESYILVDRDDNDIHISNLDDFIAAFQVIDDDCDEILLSLIAKPVMLSLFSLFLFFFLFFEPKI